MMKIYDNNNEFSIEISDTYFTEKEISEISDMVKSFDIEMTFPNKPGEYIIAVMNDIVKGITFDTLQSAYDYALYDIECFADYGDGCLEIIDNETSEIIVIC